MRTALYLLWGLLPLIFYLLALWGWLEQASGKLKKSNPGDLVRQGTFVLICVLISVALDQWILEWLTKDLLANSVPLLLLQIILLPAVLCIGASVIGPSREIMIAQAPRPSNNRKPDTEKRKQ